MKTKEKIEVMQAYLDGKTIQVYCGIKYGWGDGFKAGYRKAMEE